MSISELSVLFSWSFCLYKYQYKYHSALMIRVTIFNDINYFFLFAVFCFITYGCCCCSVVQLCLTLCRPMDCSMPGFPVLDHLSPKICSNSCPMSQWCHPTILSSVIPFSSCLQSFPATGSFLINQLFASGGQSIGASASTSASVLPMNIQDWFPLGLTGLISLQSKALSRVFSNTTAQKQFFSVQPSLWSNCHIHPWLLEKPKLTIPLLAK